MFILLSVTYHTLSVDIVVVWEDFTHSLGHCVTWRTILSVTILKYFQESTTSSKLQATPVLDPSQIFSVLKITYSVSILVSFLPFCGIFQPQSKSLKYFHRHFSFLSAFVIKWFFLIAEAGFFHQVCHEYLARKVQARYRAGEKTLNSIDQFLLVSDLKC